MLGIAPLMGQKKKNIEKIYAKKVVTYRPTVYLGASNFAGGAIKPADFEKRMRQGLRAKDSLGNELNVVDFSISYYEKNVYQDNNEQIQIMTDVYTEYCEGDTLPIGIAASLYERVKWGDTVSFHHIHLAKKGAKTRNDTLIGLGFNCAIIK